MQTATANQQALNKNTDSMHWYVIHTKPRQEQRAKLNLEQQGYECYLPLCTIEKMQRQRLVVTEEPLFPRYLFIHLGSSDDDPSWVPICSTIGVTKLVKFGQKPAKISDHLIDILKTNDKVTIQPNKLFTPGEHLIITDGVFKGLEAIYQMDSGENRVMVLIEILNKPTILQLEAFQVRKID